jgi:hypothetical protein
MRIAAKLLALLLFFACSFVRATEIKGVQPAALDQPRINACITRTANGPALLAKNLTEQTINFQAFLDTGASGVMLSQQTADALHVGRESTPKGNHVLFQDIGVGGGDTFQVSEPLYVHVAPFGKNEPTDLTGYPIFVGPVRTQVAMGGGLIAMLTGGLDVVGMPAMEGKIAIMDPKPVDSFADTMRAQVIDPHAQGNARADIPKTNRHVQLTYVSFARFTTLIPPTAQGPALAGNPMIGPNPITHQGAAPPIVVTMHGQKASGTWLLDTGAAASMISKAEAAKLGITYVDGTEGTESPKLAGVPDSEQFSMTIGGVGGQKKSAGFFLDSLSLPTREHDPLVYRKAPVLVADITVQDPKSKGKITLDGVLGMNYFVASAYVSETGMLPDIGKMSAGPYDWIVFDQPRAELGLMVKKELLGSGQGNGTIQITPSHRNWKNNSAGRNN